ncbi:MAG: hypothetical protein VKJ46_12155 [Leptolyngbyaceae bacterium]|nr:hypothetical protein [Leptolyngbyaceae bacterium]
MSVNNDSTVLAAYFDFIVGAAIFDLNGLPKEYFTTGDNDNLSWVQTIFQALGLRSLLMSSLQLEGFHYAMVHGGGYSAIVVKQPSRYFALLVRKTESGAVNNSFLQWLQELEPSTLRANARFQVA